MAPCRVVSALLLAASAASAEPIGLIQTDGVSAAVTAQVKLVQKIIAQLQQEHRKVTKTESETLNLVDETLAKTTLPNIESAHDADLKLLGEGIATIKACDDILKDTVEIDAAKKASDAAKTLLDTCRGEEKAALEFSDGEQKKLDDFVAEASKGPGDCDLPDPTPLDESPDSMAGFFDKTKGWFTGKKGTLATLRGNAQKAQKAHEDKATECNSEKQPDYEGNWCTWGSQVTVKRSTYNSCRKGTQKQLDATFDDVNTKSGHRKSDFKAVTRVRCLLKVLMIDSGADTATGELNKCLDAKVETTQLDISKPSYPSTADDELANLGDLSSPPTDCNKKASE